MVPLSVRFVLLYFSVSLTSYLCLRIRLIVWGATNNFVVRKQLNYLIIVLRSSHFNGPQNTKYFASFYEAQIHRFLEVNQSHCISTDQFL